MRAGRALLDCTAREVGMRHTVATYRGFVILGLLATGLLGLPSTVAAQTATQAKAVTGTGGSGSSEIDGLSINGIRVPVTGDPNQTIPIVGGAVILNEQQTGAGGAVVNALHVIVSGVADVVVASATAATP